ncbi:Feruloyl esterase B [Tolypocladium ophioglossoides CBS 100239]|uniref:feruloyl esterase n=1 Tax=Tolypocladium ophioglossoides (strain CBS 100239) TaxID=1163406 RepID=A0A0L0NCX6_TOLOC|nr:Feruloyl esterase B [Tolypocladium ophioglossoides CBS 100239]
MALLVRSCIPILTLLLGLFSAVKGAAAQRPLSKGCTTPHNWAGQTREFSFESSGGTRSYRIHLPSSYAVNKALPLLIAYHGSGNNPTKFETETRFSDESVNPDTITVYPAGVKGNWQGPTYAEPGVSDLVFTTDLVNRIKDNYCVDQSRVYATGHSNGAGFTGTLACSPEHGGQFAAFAPVSGAFYTDVKGDENCHPARSPLPMFEAHGTADPIIPYNGGKGRGGPLPSIPYWLSRWAQRNQCTTSSTKDLPNGVHDTKWTCAGVDGLLRHLKIDGHNHSWPGKKSEIDISPVVIEFLSAFHKP